MPPHRILAIFLVVAWLLPATAAGAAGFTVEHHPTAVPGEYRASAEPPLHYWVFETRVHNGTDRPLRVVEFDAQYWDGTTWRDSPNEEPFGAGQFRDWYTDGDSLVGGWLQPGDTAVDAGNWIRSWEPRMDQARWYYVAQDPDGEEYRAAAVVDPLPYPTPAVSPPAPAGDGTVALALSMASHSGVPLGDAQWRIEPLGPSREAWFTLEGTSGQLELPAPGFYRLVGFASGHRAAALPLALPGGAEGVGVEFRLPPHEGGETVGLELRGSPTAANAVELHRDWDEEMRDWSEAFQAHREANITLEGFERDLSTLATRLVERSRQGADSTLARFAAFLALQTPHPFEEAASARFLELLPPESPLWRGRPTLAVQSALRAADPMASVERLSTSNPDPRVRAEAILSLARGTKSRREHEQLAGWLEQLRREYAKLPGIRARIADLERAERLVEGEAVGEFDLPDMEGDGRIRSADLLGQPLLLHFWATWCGPCLTEMPELHAAYERFAPGGLQLLSISLDQDRSRVDRLRNGQWAMPWRHVLAADDPAVQERFGVTALPNSFLVDAAGTIVASGPDLRGDALEETLQQRLASPTLPTVDIYLAELAWADGRPTLVGAPINATARPGYDNQPAFTPDGHAFYYTAGTPDGQTDIFRCAIPCEEPERITNTPGEGEFSPRPTPDGRQISYIHQAAGGYGGQVWLDHPDGGGGRPADPRGPFGYYAWDHAQSRLAVFALADPFRLDVFGVEGDTTRVTVAEEIGRALYAAPDGRSVYFTKMQPDSNFAVYRGGFGGEAPAVQLFVLPAGAEDYVVFAHPGGGDAFLAVAGSALVYRNPASGAWEAAGELGLEGITRLALSPDRRKLALVATDGRGQP